MIKKIFLVLILVLLPAISWADEYVLVMSKEDNVCQHMLKIYNEDLRKYGEVRYEEHKEFNWITWEDKEIRIRSIADIKFRSMGGIPQKPEKEKNAKITFFDINNDSKDEVIVYRESMLSGNPMYVYDIFRYDDFELLNRSEIIDNLQYFETKLKNVHSWQDIPINIYDISKAGIKKLPKRFRLYIDALKKSGNKDLNFISGSKKINFLRINNHFFVSFEGQNIAYNPDGPHENFGEYSIISELQKDNILRNHCLYFINKDKSTNRGTK